MSQVVYSSDHLTAVGVPPLSVIQHIQRLQRPTPGPPRGVAVGGGKWQEAAGGGRLAGMGRRGARATAVSNAVPPGAAPLPPPLAPLPRLQRK